MMLAKKPAPSPAWYHPTAWPRLGRDKGADDSEDGGENETLRLIASRHDEFGDNANDKPDDDRPKNVHVMVLPGQRMVRPVSLSLLKIH
jgi:hypothetical protein